jgi:uncharacterized protein YjdB
VSIQADHQRLASNAGRRIRRLAAASFVALLAAACSGDGDPLAPSTSVRLSVTPSYAVTDASAPAVVQVRATATAAGAGTLLGTRTQAITSPTQPFEATLDLNVPSGGSTNVVVLLELLSQAGAVEWSGRFGPFQYQPGSTPAAQTVTFVRGGAGNLDVTGVSIAAAGPVNEGTQVQLVASVAGGSAGSVNWRSLDPTLATVGPTGQVTALLPGTARIEATAGAHRATLNLVIQQVMQRLAIEPATQTLLAIGAETTLAARGVDARGGTVAGTEVAWTVAEGTSVESLGGGRFRALANGRSVVRAATTFRGQPFATTAELIVAQGAGSVSIAPDAVTITAVGGTRDLVITVRDANGNIIGSPAVTWTSSNESVATVNASGRITAASPGSALIRATAGEVFAEVPVSVSQAVSTIRITPSTAALDAFGARVSFTAEAIDAGGSAVPGVAFNWLTTTPGVLAVDAATGAAEAIGNGAATVIAASGTARGSAVVNVQQVAASATVTPTAGEIPAPGGTLQYTAVVRDRNSNVIAGATPVWTSLDPAIATVNAATGLVTAQAEGTTTIRAAVGTVNATGAVTVLAGAPVGEGTLAGRVVDPANGNAPVAGVVVEFELQPAIVPASSRPSPLLRTSDVAVIIFSTTTGPDGRWISPLLPAGCYTITFRFPGYVNVTMYVICVVPNATTPVEQAPIVPDSPLPGGISGRVENAVDGGSIGGATVELRIGINNTSGTPLATQTADGSGNFSFTGLAAQVYTVRVTAPDFAPAARTGVAVGGTTRTGQNVSMSPLGNDGLVRVVLTWGATPSDLDSHLTGPLSGGGRFHVYYASSGSLNSSPWASLDRDDTSSFGPETITITQEFPGVYRYSIHDYSNRGSSSSTAMANSGAKVEVYRGAVRIAQYFVPSGVGTLWTVFELNNGVLTPINAMSNQSNPAAVTSIGNDAATDDARAVLMGTRSNPKR